MIEQLIPTYGYAVILLGTFLEGETVLVAAGVLAHLGYLELPWVIACAFFGTVCGDQLFFFLGSQKSRGFLRPRRVKLKKAGRVLRLLYKHQVLVILGSRFLYGLRSITPFLIGSSGVPTVRFVVLNAIGAAVWSVAIGWLGYLLGETFVGLLKAAKRYELAALAVIMLVGVLFWLVHFYRARKDKTPYI